MLGIIIWAISVLTVTALFAVRNMKFSKIDSLNDFYIKEAKKLGFNFHKGDKSIGPSLSGTYKNCTANIIENNTTITDLKELWEKVPNNKEIKIGIIEILNERRAINSNDFLLEYLDEIHDDEIILQVIKLIGEIGTKKAVEPLLKMKKFIFMYEVETAILKIQSRLKNADSGQLSLTEQNSKEGALSLTEDDKEGGLSISEKE